MKTVGRDKETRAVKRYPIHQFELAVQINLIGTFRVLAASAAGMADLDPLEDGEKGLIINTASVAAQDGQIGQAAYSASKAGVLGMALPIARDLMGEGIRVNTILPGVFETPMVAMMPQNVKDALAAQVPFPSGSAARTNMPASPCSWRRTRISTANMSGWTAPFEWRPAERRGARAEAARHERAPDAASDPRRQRLRLDRRRRDQLSDPRRLRRCRRHDDRHGGHLFRLGARP
jgi:NAD(P)-dependent dehydrogenase (short-subunit alcohol dehydrogenase family)